MVPHILAALQCPQLARQHKKTRRLNKGPFPFLCPFVDLVLYLALAVLFYLAVNNVNLFRPLI